MDNYKQKNKEMDKSLDSSNPSTSQSSSLIQALSTDNDADSNETLADKLRCLRSQPKTPKILLVEDNPVMQVVNRAFLEMLGCQVNMVEDGQTALKQYNKGYDLIFIDIGLPDIDGKSVCRMIRQKGDSEIPIIAFTSNSELSRPECIQAGMNDFLRKPASLLNISIMLARWLPDYKKIEIN